MHLDEEQTEAPQAVEADPGEPVPRARHEEYRKTIKIPSIDMNCL